MLFNLAISRYIPVPTGNSSPVRAMAKHITVYPCTYRELEKLTKGDRVYAGISLYLQGTHYLIFLELVRWRYIPVPTGNSF